MPVSTGVKSFVPSIWSNELIIDFEGQAIINQITFPVPMTNRGTYIINRFGKVAVADYTGEVEYGDLSTVSIECKCDQEKYFAFAVADVTKAQVAGDLRQPAIHQASYSMAKAVDDHAIAKVLADGKVNKEVKALEKAYELYETVVDLNMKLNKKDVPQGDRIILMSYKELALLQKDTDFKANVHRNNMENGMEVFMLNGVTILPTNRVEDGTIIALHKSALAYAVQVDSIEAMRLETTFADGIRGLMTFGVTVVRPEAIEIVKAK